MALGSKNGKQPTRKQILEAAAEQDGRRQEQINNQKLIINRLLEVNQHYESVLDDIASNYYESSTVHDMARLALDHAAEINKRHRKEDSNG